MPSPTKPRKMHADELDIDEALVARLVAEQFPQWARLPVTRVASAGTDNAMYRLGADMVVRLPRLPGGARQVDREHRWLPHVAPHLPLAVPTPLAKGEPGAGYALPWGVYDWLDGENAYDAPLAELRDAAGELGRFVAALRTVDAVDGPLSFRGDPASKHDTYVRAAIHDLDAAGTLDAATATAAWEDTLHLPPWDAAPVWLHSDLLPGNLLTSSGRLTAVIDFGGLGVGDPAADTIAAWTVFDAETREVFREAAGVDEATWARGRGWALCFGLMAEHYYGDVCGNGTNPVLAAVGRRAVAEVLAEYEEGRRH
ncbi:MULTISPECIES: aminoglycoside phosphotransferase family protein [unclassified Streptomyces]|uniref:aminoglycoside phosphotransferase family protein n=1 Tax=unclassified Streptomyces TaxID=2593676 RepID=UPI002365ED54|nr:MULTISPECIES: aminoglycoside phosphotransferase family protein [unclassified Streptomyces]MDF3147735.1 aminoglycoside phosphotransferase family protein [Streptomyces sp. T21Q-yed]WDF37889.1 aminoglycoside phosphotransferase family protein [Streptomyces sp. T12]